MELIYSLKEELSEIDDPRVLGRTRHSLLDVLVLSVLAIICQAETFVDIESFGKAKESWLSKFLDLPNGIPSHDTIARVFSLIDPEQFELAFISWVNRVRARSGVKDVLCFDGKTVAGTISHNEGQGRTRLNLVSVWSTAQGLVLGQRKAGSGGQSEKAAAAELLDLIDVKDVTIVADAGIGSSGFVNKVVEKGGDYIFPIKANTRPLHSELVETFEGIPEKNSASKIVETHSSKDKGHGRKEQRHCTIIRKKNFAPSLAAAVSHLDNAKVLGRVVYESKEKETRPTIQSEGRYIRTTDKIRTKKEVRYFVSSLDLSAKSLMDKLRLQWSIESRLHWVLDVSLGEDGNKTRNHIAAENLAVVRKIAINLVRQDKASKIGVRSKLKRAGWDSDYLETLLFGTKLA